MKKNFPYLLILALIVVFTSCKSVTKITNKDNSTNANNRTKKKRKVEFIDGIEVTPGTVVKSKHKPKTTKYINTVEDVPKELIIDDNAKSIVEKAKPIQIKYAIELNTYLENITNVGLYNAIEDWMGTRYCYGGNSKNCIDCSAFTGVIYKAAYKVDLPRTSSDQYNLCTKIDRSELKEGDLIFFATKGRSVSHVGIYLHNNKFVHSSTSSGVIITDLDDSYWGKKYLGCGRIFE